jgi:biopolymer transport protein ExbD
MASLDTGDGGGGHKKGPGVKKAKKQNTRVDMTPMVDLAFLLITFFIFTATMNDPTTMALNMPKDTDKKDELTKTKQSGALTIMLGKNNNLFYYEGELLPDGSNFKSARYSEIRDIIIKKKKSVEAAYVRDPECEAKKQAAGLPISGCRQTDFFVMIKPTDEASYKNTVDILDEMTINNVERYAIVKVADSEMDLIKATEGIAPQQ